MAFLNYPNQEFEFSTSDGYILKMFRIQAQNSTIIEGLRPILLLPGLACTADIFVKNIPKHSFALALADAGFDVFIINFRGTLYSRKHAKFDSDHDGNYWNFTFQEMGKYDMPAAIDIIYQLSH